MTSSKNSLTAAHVLFPLSLLAFVIFMLMAFQASQILRDRDALHAAKTQQDKPLEESQKLQTQLDALAIGTKKLAEQGDKNAQSIIDRMKQLGITVNENKPGTAAAPTNAQPAPDAAPAQ
jgi:hypothetical protein